MLANFSNIGMENIYNTVQVAINTGSKLVKAIDICFKYANKPEVFVMEKYISWRAAVGEHFQK